MMLGIKVSLLPACQVCSLSTPYSAFCRLSSSRCLRSAAFPCLSSWACLLKQPAKQPCWCASPCPNSKALRHGAQHGSHPGSSAQPPAQAGGNARPALCHRSLHWARLAVGRLVQRHPSLSPIPVGPF